MSQRPDWRSQVAGGFATVHIILVLTTAFGPAADLPGALGIASGTWNRWHQATRPAMRLYGSLLGPKQSWAMFGSVGHKSAQLRIEVLESERWQVIFAERSDTETWNRSHFDHYRWREFLWDLGKTRDPKPHLQRFTNWVAPKVFADYPGACRVRVRVFAGEALSPQELRSGEHRRFDELRRRSRPVRRSPPCL